MAELETKRVFQQSLRTKEILPGYNNPAGSEIIHDTLYDRVQWVNTAGSTMVNDYQFFGLGGQGRDFAQTNVDRQMGLPAGTHFLATHFGIFVDIMQGDGDLQHLLMRQFKRGVATIVMGDKEYTTLPMNIAMVSDEDGSIGAGGGTVIALKTGMGMMTRLKMPIEFAPLEKFYVQLHFTNIPVLNQGATFYVDAMCVFDGICQRPIV